MQRAPLLGDLADDGGIELVDGVPAMPDRSGRTPEQTGSSFHCAIDCIPISLAHQSGGGTHRERSRVDTPGRGIGGDGIDHLTLALWIIDLLTGTELRGRDWISLWRLVWRQRRAPAVDLSHPPQYGMTPAGLQQPHRCRRLIVDRIGFGCEE